MGVLKKIMANIMKCLNYGNLYIPRGFKIFGRQYTFC